jgi:hypothetical protein
MYCTESAVLDHFWPPNIQCLWPAIPLWHQMYSVRSLLDAHFNLLDYRRHLCLLHLFIYDSTSRRYNLSFTMSSDPLMSCLGAVPGSLLSSMSVCPECWQLSDWLTVIKWLAIRSWITECSLNQILPYRIWNTFSHGLSSIATIWLLKKRLTFNSICCRGSVGSVCWHRIAMDLYFSVLCIRKTVA